MALAGTLEIQILASIARLQADMAQAKGIVGSSMRSIEGAVGTAKGILASLGIGLGVGYFVSLVKGSVDAQDHLNDLNKTTKITVENLSGLKLAAKQTGGDLDSIAASINKLSQNMGKDAERFKALGVSAKDPLEALKQLADIYVHLEDPQQRAAVMAAALGKSWAGAAPLLAEGGARIQEIVDKGRLLSGQTKEMAEQADKFNDEMAELNTTLGATKTKLVVDALPAMNDIAAAMNEAAKESGLLMTAWVGLGGVAANLFKTSDAKRLKEIQQDIVKWQEKIAQASGKQNTLGMQSVLDNLLAQEAQIANRIASIVEPPKKPPAPGVDPAAAAEAAARAQAFLDHEKNIAAAAAELKLFNAALQQVEMELGKLNDQTAVEAMLYKVLKGSLVELTDEHKVVLLNLSVEIDKKRELERINKNALEWARAYTAEQEKMDAVVSQFNLTQSESIKNIEFETQMLKLEAPLAAAGLLTKADEIKLISKLNLERETATGLRQIELNLEKALIALGPETNDNYEAAAKSLRDLAAAQKAALPDALAAREAAKLANALNKNTVDEFQTIWSTVEQTGKSAFIHLMGEGKSAFTSIGQTIKTAIIDLLYQLTVRKWIINIGASISASMGMSGVANAAGGGGFGNLFSGMSNLFGGGGLTSLVGNSLSGAGFLGASPMFGSVGGAELAALAALEGGGVATAGMTAASFLPALGPLGLGIGALALLGAFGGGGGTPAVLTGRDMPSGAVSYGGGLSGDVYGNDANQGYRWVGEQWSNTFVAEIKSVYDEISKIGHSLGLDTSKVRDYRASITTGQFMGQYDILPAVLAQVSDQLANQLMPNLKDFAKAGESAAQTLVRLANEARTATIEGALGRMNAVVGLRDATADLWLSELSPLTARERMNRSNDRFNQLYGAAQGGDIKAISDLQGFTRSNLAELASFYGTSTPEYRALFEQRQGQIGGLFNEVMTEDSIAIANLDIPLSSLNDTLKGMPKEISDAITKAVNAWQEAHRAVVENSTDQIVGAVINTAQQTAIIDNGAAGGSYIDDDRVRGTGGRITRRDGDD